MKITKLLSVMCAIVGLCSGAAAADYVNPPGWDDDTDYTHQAWEFNMGDIPLVADDGHNNPFGDPTLTDVFLCNPDYMFWVWEAMGGGTRYGHWGGMHMGAVGPEEVAVSLTFEVPNFERAEPWSKQLWMQVVYWGGRGAVPDQTGDVLTVEIARDAAFQDVYVTYEAVIDDIEDQSETGQGSSGQFWRFTHTFPIEDQPGLEYVRLRVVPADSMAVFFDSLSIDTHCVSMGDMNCDGTLDGLDIQPFLLAMFDPAAYEVEYEGCNILNGDFDHSGVVDVPDVEVFVDALIGG